MLFGHTPTRYLPANGRKPHDIYICGSAVGIDTGCGPEDPLSCVNVETMKVYQSYIDGEVVSYQAKTLNIPRVAVS
ncbi:MAG: hypothetical protein IPK14_26285 [Blastocatellia bacterium]|nr:hypothetical protein [Blastocatellia bacterium]